MPGFGTVPVEGRAVEVRALPTGLIEVHALMGTAGATTVLLQLLPAEAEALQRALETACARLRQWAMDRQRREQS